MTTYRHRFFTLLLALAVPCVVTGMKSAAVVPQNSDLPNQSDLPTQNAEIDKKIIVPSLAQLAVRQYLIHCIKKKQDATVFRGFPKQKLIENIMGCPWAWAPMSIDLDIHKICVHTYRWSPDGTKMLIAVEDEDAALIIDGETGNFLVEIEHEDPVYSALWSPDGSKIATGSESALKILDPETGQVIVDVPCEDVFSLEWSPDGSKIACNDTIIDSKTGTVLAVMPDFNQVRSLEWSPDSRRILTYSQETVKIHDGNSGTILANILHRGKVTSAHWNPDGTKIVTASEDATIQIVDAQTAECIGRNEEHVSGVNSAEWSSDGSNIITASKDGTAKIVDGTTGKSIAAISHPNQVLFAHWSPDGSKIVTASEDGTVKISQRTGEEVATIKHQHQAGVQWSPDSSKIATFSHGTTNIIGAETGAVLVSRTCWLDRTISALWSPDSRKIMTQSLYGGHTQIYGFSSSDDELIRSVVKQLEKQLLEKEKATEAKNQKKRNALHIEC